MDGMDPAETKAGRYARTTRTSGGLNSATFDPEEFLEGIGRGAGTRPGCTYAAPVRGVLLQPVLTCASPLRAAA